MFDQLIEFIRDYYQTSSFIPLHEPSFGKKELSYVSETINTSFVSSVGEFVERFERQVANYTGSPAAVATVNGSSALHTSLLLAGTGSGDLVLTQPLTFVATCNAISYCGAEPIFIDVDRHTFGLSPKALKSWLDDNATYRDFEAPILNSSKRVIRACLPMHTFGHPVELNELSSICKDWNIILIEDAAEALGSLYNDRHVGTFGSMGTLSFNGNKIITSGGGGMILAGVETAASAKHLTTTSKQPHEYEFYHNETGYNYRMPNLNAALGCAQMEKIEVFVEQKRALAARYADFFGDQDVEFFEEPPNCRSNYWLNAVICEDIGSRNELLKKTNENEVMTRPIWQLMTRLPMFTSAIRGDLSVAEWLEPRIVNLPSSVTLNGDP